jgi:hypothetical protein
MGLPLTLQTALAQKALPNVYIHPVARATQTYNPWLESLAFSC